MEIFLSSRKARKREPTLTDSAFFLYKSIISPFEKVLLYYHKISWVAIYRISAGKFPGLGQSHLN
jgi:hypothetical protein